MIKLLDKAIVILMKVGGDEFMNAGFLTTHVLDTGRGMPAANLKISLYKLDGDARTHLCDMHTNDDGRTNSPILPKEQFEAGRYMLIFHAGAYLEAHYDDLPEPKFLDEVPLIFGMADADSHYHVPLLLSPYGYSTYRGS